MPAPPPRSERTLPDANLLSDCVHCGFCLPTCPTYVLWGEEMDSPRGRIHLMEQVEQGAPVGASTATHIDRCLGCMACVTACPSGVQYGPLVEKMRVTVEEEYDRTAKDRLLRRAIFALFPYPRRLRLLRGPLAAYQRSGLSGLVRRSGLLERLSPTLRTMEALAPPLSKATRLPARVSARGTPRRATVGLLTGCVQDAFFPDVNAATARVLAMEGCDVVVPPRQSCCGALSMHNGRDAEARSFAKRTIETFEEAGVDLVVTNAAGCGSAMKEYAHLLADEPGWASRAEAFADRTRDLTEALVELGPVAERHPLPLTVAYHDACHLAHAQGVRQQPRTLLGGVPGLTVREIAQADICCGSAGIYNLLHPEAASDLGDRKAGHVLSTGADLLVTGNPGCMLQIAAATARRGVPLRVASTATLLDASLRGLGSAALVRHGADTSGSHGETTAATAG
ncbi:MAG: (Fe-S)-binding protein [Actinomycetes bacterium]